MRKTLSILLIALMLLTLSGCKTETSTNIDTVVDNNVQVEDEDLLGSYTEVEDGTLTDELNEIFYKAIEGLTVANYTPIKLLATQVVAGINYKFLASGIKTTAPIIEGTYNIIINKDLNGNISLLDIETVEEKEVLDESKEEELLNQVNEYKENKPKFIEETKDNKEVDKTINYWVVFYNPDGHELQRTAQKYGTIPVFEEGTPTYWDSDYFYNFTHWEDKYGNIINEFTPIEGNTYIYAMYEIGGKNKTMADKNMPTPIPTPSTFTVYFDVGGIGTSPDNITGLSSGSIISKPNAPTSSANSFCGWYRDSGYSAKWIFASDTVTSDTTLYAKWHASATPCSINRTYLLHITGTIVPGWVYSGEYFKYDESLEKFLRQGNYTGGSPGDLGWFHVNNCNSGGYTGGAGILCTDIDCHDHN